MEQTTNFAGIEAVTFGAVSYASLLPDCASYENGLRCLDPKRLLKTNPVRESALTFFAGSYPLY